MNSNLKIGDVCIYPCNSNNNSLCIVEIIKELSSEVVVVKFHQVMNDESGNNYFNYLLKSGKTMNVSTKYLSKIDIINEQKENVKQLKDLIKTQSAIIKIHDALLDEFEHRLKECVL